MTLPLRSHPYRLLSAAVLFWPLTIWATTAHSAAPTWASVQTLFAERCVMCHAGADAPLGLKLESYDTVLKGSSNGPIVKAGDLAGSELLRRVRGESQPQMPLSGPPFLSAEEVKLLEAWVGAGMPKGEAVEAAPVVPARPRPGPNDTVTFADVEPIFMKRCVKCHKDNGKMGAPPEGLRLDSYANIVMGSERLVVLPGNAGLSELARRIEGKSQPRMPFDGPPYLDADDIRLINQWIRQGAVDKDGNLPPDAAGRFVRFRGEMTGPNEIDGAEFRIGGGTRIDKSPRPGSFIELRGVVTEDGTVEATRLRAK